MAEGRYVYGIIRGEEPRTFEAQGIWSEAGQVCTVNAAGLGAVVSDSPVVDYERSRRNMMVHTLALEEVMRQHTVLPVRFGTVAPNEGAGIPRLLERRSGEFHSLLDEMEGRVELGLKVFWREERLFQEIVEEYPDIRRLRDATAGKSAEAAHYERIRLGEMVAEAIKRKRESEAELLLNRLSPAAYKCRSNPVLGEKMVLNAAFLVDRAGEDEFAASIGALDSEMADRRVFKYIRPAPPYNFVNLIISWNE